MKELNRYIVKVNEIAENTAQCDRILVLLCIVPTDMPKYVMYLDNEVQE